MNKNRSLMARVGSDEIYGEDTLQTTVDQWRAALAAIQEPAHPECRTLTELSKELDMNRCTLADQLGKAIACGKVKVLEDVRNNRVVKVYQLLEEKDG